jgi:ubiquinone/menaquinone biosynthesis C-methylase UbiE
VLSEEEILKLIMRHAPKKGRILEVGCKHCDIAIALASVVIGYVKKTSGKPKGKIHDLHVLDRTKNIIYGIDSSKLAITNAKKKSRHLTNIFCNVMRAEKLDFRDNFFKLVYSIRTLHETNAKNSLKEMYRVLTPNGILVIIDWTKQVATAWSEKSFDPDELKQMILHAGFARFKIQIKNDFYVLITKK